MISAERPKTTPPARLASAMKAALREGYSWREFHADCIAGMVVGVIALPLSMALAIACGVPPQHGLYTAIVGGFIIALLGGSRTSVSGPTAAFVVVLTPIAARYGFAGLAIASMMAGAMLVVMGLARLGKLIEFVAHPVTTGFTSGIAVVIFTLQLKDFFGLRLDRTPESFVDKVAALAASAPTVHWPDAAIGLMTLVVLIVWPRLVGRVPAALAALSLAAVVGWQAELHIENFQVDTLNRRFSYTTESGVEPGIPRSAPQFSWPWEWRQSNEPPLELSFELIRQLSPAALAIAVLGAIESLLCAVVAAGMTGQKHDPDGELIAQGVGNLVAPLFGGFAATAAIARSGASIRAGARSPVAAAVHALFVLLAMMGLAPLLGYLPMASFAALLMVVAWNVSEAKHFVRTLRVAPRSDIAVLLVCFSLTVMIDMMVAVAAGVVLSSLLFMKRMSELTSVERRSDKHPRLVATLPTEVALYEIAGPLFFGAAERAAGAIAASRSIKAVILYMGDVPSIDMTGVVALTSAIKRLQASGAMVVLAGVQPQPGEVLRRAGVSRQPGRLSICRSIEEAEMLLRLALPDLQQPSATPA